MSYVYKQFYIDGKLGGSGRPKEFKVINPATEEVAGVISMGSPKDVDLAVAAARRAFDSVLADARAERRELLERILAGYTRRYQAEIGDAIRDEMGAPTKLAQGGQAIGDRRGTPPR
jgi:aldehyde dehydrogenase (NAD+)